ncbi:MAG: preprotein translocase subunit SecG [Parcubacteria group bacterium CG1_02_42_13]|uniref:Protein-export membrane protein SecG n=1 Tax=Candidatus Portnoybacteria bacterium CG02_land_8_20_14_3_00_45_8 TaxID=1974807 RepID=A0A2M7D5V2_9BACT|nr:MAG: preprotein translocase subunit SecG [Parcubacteria group bacterium CG1_02_42_13]PIV38401.1 MAG: preprotein translocase subunit SecG [Candidatus Portnoybacteria bacterium CG02_land_8_20_14_3_00_45_8]HCX27830.1 preprotein translocase subunit SecG [Candidatus Portnoybacteria bacterium]
MNLPKILSITQIVLSSLLVVSILLQQRGAGSSAITGGTSASYYTKRGFEKILFISTIVLAILFLLAAVGSMLIAAK